MLTNERKKVHKVDASMNMQAKQSQKKKKFQLYNTWTNSAGARDRIT